MKNPRTLVYATLLLVLMASCSGLSKEAKQMVGDYYMTAISADAPMMELKSNGKCVMHAYGKDNVVSISVPGKWNVENDSLKMWLRPEDLTFKGDSSLIGDVPRYLAKKIVDFTGLSLTVSVDGVNYTYSRRGHAVEKEVREKQLQQAKEGE